MTPENKQRLMITLMDLVGEMELDTDLDWSLVNTNAYESLGAIAQGMVDLYASWENMDAQERELIMLATMTKLSLENFVLNVHRFAGR